jgi:hypothetical protein
MMIDSGIPGWWIWVMGILNEVRCSSIEKTCVLYRCKSLGL